MAQFLRRVSLPSLKRGSKKRDKPRGRTRANTWQIYDIPEDKTEVSRQDCGRYYVHVDGLVKDCSISIANALEVLQSWTKPTMCN